MIERRVRVAAFVRAPERRLGFGRRSMFREQHAELDSGSIVAAIRRTTVCRGSLVECPSLPEQHPEPERTVGNATLIGPAIRRLGFGPRATVLEQHAMIERRVRVAAFVRAPERRLGFGRRSMFREQHAELDSASIVAALRRATVCRGSLVECPSLPEQHPEPERTVGIATLIGPAIRRLGLGQRPLLFEQSAEVRGGGAMATLISATVGSLRFNHAPLAFEQQTEVESASAVADLVGATVSRLGLGQRPLLFEQSAEVRGGGAMVTLIGVTIGRMRFNHAPLVSDLLAEVESASGLGRLGEIVRLFPRQPAVCAIADASRTCLGAMPVGVNLGGPGDDSVNAIRRHQGFVRQRRRFRVDGRPRPEDGPALAARVAMPKRSDQQASNEYQRQRKRQTDEDDRPWHASRATLVG
jgi:hypothetical protein